jgi:hypothetical protein
LEKRKHNPIDEDKIAENPHLLPYAHTLGGAIIKPLDKGRIKGLAMSAMYEQTGDKLNQIKKQIDLLVQQAQDIHDRLDLSEKIYEAKYSFKPIIGQQYFLYQQEEEYVLSMISPTEWGKKGAPYEYLASAKVLSDHTWEITDKQKQDIDIEL